MTMTNELVPVDPFALAEKVSKSNLIPTAYRGKATDAAICMMYGAEVGLPPMTALQRIIVINGKPTLDAQGMAALIRGAGHSLMGEVTDKEATVTGKRGDNGDTMSFSFSMDDAKRAGLVKKGPWTDYPKSMLWARAVSQLARQLFPDVLMGMSYVPEEIGGDAPEPEHTSYVGDERLDVAVPDSVPDPDDSIVDAEVVEDVPPLVDADTGEIIPEPAEVPEAPAPAANPHELKVVLNDLIQGQPDGEGTKLRSHLLTMFGPAANRTVEQMQESVNIAAGWPIGAPSDNPEF